jgi:hypothetical protein
MGWSFRGLSAWDRIEFVKFRLRAEVGLMRQFRRFKTPEMPALAPRRYLRSPLAEMFDVADTHEPAAVVGLERIFGI